MTNTKVKFVIVVESSNTNLRDNEIRSVSFNDITSGLVYVHRAVNIHTEYAHVYINIL